MQAPLVISAKGVSKKYRLGVLGGATLADDVKVKWAKMRGRPNPLAPIGSEQDHNRDGDHFWALRGVDFEVRQGEILGVIGKNGAGKSTLLKLLSQITSPSSGSIKIKGRTASLLEVGTGFHPELTGRENIFLNGAILGMSKQEINEKVEEIIAFSGIKHHIDTPVKRYSSGMTVRLGFAVAAHLEPEILIIDEVLAVGDAEFQKKCLGKMKDIAGSGRTIIFVSHNMIAVQNLCTRAIRLKDGQVVQSGTTNEIVKEYLMDDASVDGRLTWPAEDAPGNDKIKFREVLVVKASGEPGLLQVQDAINVKVLMDIEEVPQGIFNISIYFINEQGILVFESALIDSMKDRLDHRGTYEFICSVPGNLLNVGTYRLELRLIVNYKVQAHVTDPILFEIIEVEREGVWYGKKGGLIRPLLQWQCNAKQISSPS